MSRIIFTIFFFSALSYGLCLSCLSCNSKETCEKPETEDCKDGESCVALGDSNIPAYFKGCDKKTNYCEEMYGDEKLYQQCQVCMEDKCNDLELK